MPVRGAQYIRANTVRPNIRYIVQTAQRSKLVTTAVQICQRQLSCLKGALDARIQSMRRTTLIRTCKNKAVEL